MNYAIGCTDTISGKQGSFGFDTAEYLAADNPLQFKARTPVFDGLPELFEWAKANGVELFCVPVCWASEHTSKTL